MAHEIFGYFVIMANSAHTPFMTTVVTSLRRRAERLKSDHLVFEAIFEGLTL